LAPVLTVSAHTDEITLHNVSRWRSTAGTKTFDAETKSFPEMTFPAPGVVPPIRLLLDELNITMP
jgi:hypothetical protein